MSDLPPLTVHSVSLDSLSSELVMDRPDWHGMVTADGCPKAHCSLWWKRLPFHQGHRVGMLGHFFAEDAKGADALLRVALDHLRRHDCTLAVGPMNGSTWRDYRWVTGGEDEPAFFMEPNNPRHYPGHLLRMGFQPSVRYFSAIDDHLQKVDPRLDRVARRLRRQGLSWRSVNSDTFVDDIRGILKVARIVFRNNPFYVDPDEKEFLAECERLRSVAPMDFVHVAHFRQRIVGFVFAVPDVLKQPTDTLVIKTLAAVPDRRFAGIGQLLLARAKQRAMDAGFRRAIHALVRDVPHLRRVSARNARPIRSYTLYAKVLSP